MTGERVLAGNPISVVSAALHAHWETFPAGECDCCAKDALAALNAAGFAVVERPKRRVSPLKLRDVARLLRDMNYGHMAALVERAARLAEQVERTEP